MKGIKKRVGLIFICAIMLLGCSSNMTQEEDSTKDIKVIVPNGLPAIAISKNIKEKPEIEKGYNINYQIENTTDTLVTAVMKGEPDIAIVPSNLAAQAYNKNLGYVLAGTTGWGSLYLVSTKEDVKSIADLKGKEVFNISKGLTPDLVFKGLIEKSGVDENDISLSYVGGASELAPTILSGKADYAVVPEPTLTILKSKNKDIKVLLNLNEEWKKEFNVELGFPQGSVIVKKDLIDNDKEFISNFLDSIKNGVEWLNTNKAEGALYSEEIGVTFDKGIIEKALPTSNINFQEVKDTKNQYITYYELLEKGNPKSIGGKIPNEGFFYER